MPALATDALLHEQKKESGHWCWAAFPSRKIRRGQLPHTSPAIGNNARSKWNSAKAGRNSLAWIPAKVATDRRHFPLKDVATAGGWRDVQTMITSISSPTPRRCALWSTLQNHPTRASGC